MSSKSQSVTGYISICEYINTYKFIKNIYMLYIICK